MSSEEGKNRTGASHRPYDEAFKRAAVAQWATPAGGTGWPGSCAGVAWQAGYGAAVVSRHDAERPCVAHGA